jgi:hypothetical protein
VRQRLRGQGRAAHLARVIGCSMECRKDSRTRSFEELSHRPRRAAVGFDDLRSQLSERLIPQRMEIELTDDLGYERHRSRNAPGMIRSSSTIARALVSESYRSEAD